MLVQDVCWQADVLLQQLVCCNATCCAADVLVAADVCRSAGVVLQAAQCCCSGRVFEQTCCRSRRVFDADVLWLADRRCWSQQRVIVADVFVAAACCLSRRVGAAGCLLQAGVLSQQTCLSQQTFVRCKTCCAAGVAVCQQRLLLAADSVCLLDVLLQQTLLQKVKEDVFLLQTGVVAEAVLLSKRVCQQACFLHRRVFVGSKRVVESVV
uniref:Uncharacterized protein n=1 Tax=Knipowitschia caucasica TaxID=637954 RepID=A0AAV2M2P0_KNICA